MELGGIEMISNKVKFGIVIIGLLGGLFSPALCDLSKSGYR